MTSARRWIARGLARLAVRVSPEPEMTFTVKRVVEIDPKVIADAISGSIGRGISRGGDGIYRY